MAVGLLEFTGEHKEVRGRHRDEPPQGIFGERSDTVRGRYDANPIYQAASVPDDEFVFGPTYGDGEYFLPRPELYMYAGLSTRALLDFMDQSHGSIARDAATGLVRGVLDLLESPWPNGRITLFTSEFRNWVQNDRILDLMQAIRALYGVRYPQDLLRDDEDVHGTRVWRAVGGVIPFLLVERSEIVSTNDSAQKTVVRMLEAVKVSGNDDVRHVIHELSPREEVRVKVLLQRWAATPEERAYVLERVSRATVQRDKDVWRLMLRYRYPPNARLSERALKALHYIIGPAMARSWQRMVDSESGAK